MGKERESLVKKLEPELITPMLAEHWMENIPDFQRKIDDRQVQKLVTAIMKNEWRMNGATIVFNEKGELIDGQHRLAAIAKSGKSVYSLVVRGVDSTVATFHTIGDEKSRKLTDFLRAKHAANVGAVMLAYWRVQNGEWPIGHGISGKKVTAPIADIIKTGKEWIPVIEMLCVDPLMMAGRIVRQPSFCVFLVFYYTHIQPVKDLERLANFFARVADGLELTLNHPAYRLRQKFMSLAPGESLERSTSHALIMKALHLYLDHKDCGKLQFRIESEPFPELRHTSDKKGDK